MATLLTTLRTLPWRRAIRLRWLIAAAALLGALGVGGLLAMRALRPAAPAEILPGQALAGEIAATLGGAVGVRLATAAYLPGDRLVLYTRLDEAELIRVRSWALVQLEPYAERLAELPANETLTWVIDYGPDPAEQEVLLAPLGKAATPSAYRYVSAAPALLAQPTVAATAAAAPPLAVPAPAPTAAPVEAQPAAAPPAAATPLLSAGFDEAGAAAGDSLWLPLAGDWAMADGTYAQRSADGYDFLSLLDLPAQSDYSFEARLRLVEGGMGGGIIYNAPDLASRNGAQIVDLDQGGAYLRWGHYALDGAYQYDGGVALDPSLGDGQWHSLRVLTHGAASTVWVDGRQAGEIANLSSSGHVGLTTSQAQVEFDDVALAALPPGADLPAPTAAPAAAESVSGLSETFDAGDTAGWQVLSGTWQSLDGSYRQTSPTGSDLSSVSLFEGDAYTASVRLRLIDGNMGGGLIFNMARRDSKARSQIVNFSQGGALLQWGHFDAGGNFVFEGSAEAAGGGDGEWHTLALSVADGAASISLDGAEVAAGVELSYASGYLGLLASNSSVDFDDVTVVAQ